MACRLKRDNLEARAVSRLSSLLPERYAFVPPELLHTSHLKGNPKAPGKDDDNVEKEKSLKVARSLLTMLAAKAPSSSLATEWETARSKSAAHDEHGWRRWREQSPTPPASRHCDQRSRTTCVQTYFLYDHKCRWLSLADACCEEQRVADLSQAMATVIDDNLIKLKQILKTDAKDADEIIKYITEAHGLTSISSRIASLYLGRIQVTFQDQLI